MKDKFFIDANIFVYSFDHENQAKKIKSDQIINTAISTNNSTISYQVVQEFINVVYKKNKSFFQDPSFSIYLDKILFPLLSVFPSNELFKRAIDISGRWKLSFYDSLIIAAALESNCNSLLSEDLQHGQKIYAITIINPYL